MMKRRSNQKTPEMMKTMSRRTTMAGFWIGTFGSGKSCKEAVDVLPFGLSDRKAGITRALDPPYPQAYEYEELMIASGISGASSQHK